MCKLQTSKCLLHLSTRFQTDSDVIFLTNDTLIKTISYIYNLIEFLAHLSRRLMWAFLMKICLLSVVVVVVVVVNFSHFDLLQNYWANFNQTWHKSSLGDGYSGLFKWKAGTFPRGDNYEIAKTHWRILKSSSQEPIFTKLGTNHLWVKGIRVSSKIVPFLFQEEIIMQLRKSSPLGPLGQF